MSEPEKARPDPGLATYEPASPELFKLQSERLSQTSGWLGKAFGDAASAPSNIAGLCLVLLFVVGFILMFSPSTMPLTEYLKIAAPILTLILGYLFGKKN